MSPCSAWGVEGMCDPRVHPLACEGLSGSRRMQGPDKPHVGQSGELALQCGWAWKVPSSHLSAPAGPEQAVADRMKRGLQAQREGWRSSAAWGEGGAHHDIRRAEEFTSLSPGTVCCPTQCYRQEKSLESLDPSELAWLLWSMVT